MKKPKSNLIKEQQLGMTHGKANNILKKRLMFELVKTLKKNVCFRCNELIECSHEFSIDHKTDWLHSDNPLEMFMDLENIAYSHLKCNSVASRKPHKLTGLDDPRMIHGLGGYDHKGCKCEICSNAKKERNDRYRNKLKTR